MLAVPISLSELLVIVQQRVAESRIAFPAFVQSTLHHFAGQLSIDVDNVMALHANLAGQVTIEWGPEVLQLRTARVRGQGPKRLHINLQ